VHGDPARLRQCVDNLVSNALKASGRGMTVTVCVERRGDDICLIVADDGIGLRAEDLPRVFETFVQGDDWRHRGLGLGLSIVQRLVELHGGNVHAESDGPGSGARFVISLPPAPASSQAADIDAVAAPPVLPGVVLVVDDEVDNSRALQYLLRLEGFAVHTAADGLAALAVAADTRPDVVLCDLGLPEPMDGFDVAARLRVMFGANVHLCAYSGYGSRADVDRSLGAGFDAHITKPGTPAQIVAEIRKGLARLDALRH
jgi:CheY-like chemotaxis protein